jgi:hypothetical protein
MELTRSPTLTAPDYSLPFTLYTNASGRGIAGVLSQTRPERDAPVAYFSRKMLTRYSVSEIEALAVVEACQHFSPYLLGDTFTVVTDHSVLTALNQTTT